MPVSFEEEALEAQKAGADYLGCGAVFGSTTKTNVSCLPFDTLRQICESVQIPVVAIGGIRPDNVHELSGSGIAGVAVISGLYAAADKAVAARTFLDFTERSCVTVHKLL